jgi:hypothetical protein
VGENLQSFAYYQGLGPNELRDPKRADGTQYKMPCIDAADIAAAVDKEYLFWHGHGGKIHRFKIAAGDFQLLQQGKEVELYTSIVDGHRHALRLALTTPCPAQCCS